MSENTPKQVDWFPSIAVDNEDSVHIVWNLTSYDDDKGHNAPDPEGTIGQLEYTRWNGQTWTPQVDIGLIWYGYALRNSLTVDPTGRLRMIFKGWGTLERPANGRTVQDLWFTSADSTRADAVYAWSAPQQISSGLPAYFSDVAVDDQGVIHVIWTEGDTKGKYGVFYSHSTDGGQSWSRRVSLSGDEAVWWYRAHLKIDSSDRLHVVWEVLGDESNPATAFGQTAKAVYAQSIDGGLSWLKHEFTPALPAVGADKTPPGPQEPSVGVDGSGTVIFVYREPGTDRIMYRASADGRSWSASQPLPGVKSGVARPYDIYDMATDSAGHVHLVMIGYATGASDMAVLHAEWDGQSWTSADTVATAPPFPEYPRIAIGRGNHLHVVWFGGDNASTNRTPAGIWYSTATSTAPNTRGQIPLPSLAVLTKSQAPDRVSQPPTPTPSVLTPPTPVPLAASDRTGEGLAPTGPKALLQQPVTPVAIVVILVGVVLAAVMFFRRSITDAIDGKVYRS